MEVVLGDNGLKEFVDSDVPKSGSSDAALLVTQEELCWKV